MSTIRSMTVFIRANIWMCVLTNVSSCIYYCVCVIVCKYVHVCVRDCV